MRPNPQAADPFGRPHLAMRTTLIWPSRTTATPGSVWPTRAGSDQAALDIPPLADAPPPPRPDPAPNPYTPGLFVELVARAVDAFASFDGHRAERILGPPLAILPPQIACEQVLLPVLREIGERWHCGALTVGAEHFGTNVIRAKLLGLLLPSELVDGWGSELRDGHQEWKGQPRG